MTKVSEPHAPDSIGRRAGNREQRLGQRGAISGRCGLAVVGGLAAGVATAAFLTPAFAASKPALLAKAKVAMRQTNAQEEAKHLIPFKPGTNFTVTCGYRGVNILCTEHTGPERCVKGKPWILLSDLFPVIHGRLGESLTYGLTPTSNYCRGG